jgi:formylglycine-generating enzyme required for sulfatase activity
MTTRWLMLLALCGCSDVLGIDEPVAQGTACEPNGVVTCDGFRTMTCSSNRWEVQEKCKYSCRDAKCINVEPKSCAGITYCLDENDSCCETLWVPGGDFQLRYDGHQYYDTSFPRSVSGFFLDRFEVTTVRFRQFLAEYPASLPDPGQGAPAQRPELGWQSDWEKVLEPDGQLVVPQDASALQESLRACEGNTHSNPDATLPINCVNWYIAFAFCAWDGGRLPTEAEWQFAAARGDEQRVYPWSDPPHSEFISEKHAWYHVTGPRWVGTKPDGRGGFFRDRPENAHEDLAGNLLEWVLDGFGEPEPSACPDCVTAWGDSSVRILRGGFYGDPSVALKNATFTSAEAAAREPMNGVRCARDSRTESH